MAAIASPLALGITVLSLRSLVAQLQGNTVTLTSPSKVRHLQ